MKKEKTLYTGEFSGYSETDIKESIVRNYEITKEDIEKYDIIIAAYDLGAYDGAQFLLLKEKGTKNFFENHASHCSCYGFEGSFKPEPTTKEYLLSDKFSGGYCCDNEAVKAFLKQYFGKK